MNKELNSKIDDTLKSLEQGLDDYYAMCKKFEDEVSSIWIKEKPVIKIKQKIMVYIV